LLPESQLFHKLCGQSEGCGYTVCKQGLPLDLLLVIESQMGRSLNSISRQFLLECQPSSEVDPGYVGWLGWTEFWSDNLDAVPLRHSLLAGFVIFASAGDGAPYMVNAHTNEIHLISNGTIQTAGLDPKYDGNYLPFTKAGMDLCAEEIWPSSLAFMQWLALQVEA